MPADFFRSLLRMSTRFSGGMKLVWLGRLNDSMRNWKAFDSANLNRCESDVFRWNRAGPSRMLRPELPKR